MLLDSTVKGVPRCLKSKHLSLRFLWSLSVMFLITIGLHEASLVIIQYMRHEYSSYSKDISAPFSDVMGYPGPALTICNLNSFSGNASDRIRALELITLKDYEELVERLTNCERCTAKEKLELRQTRSDLLTPHGYYAYIGRDNAQTLSHHYPDLIPGCFEHKTDGFRSHMKVCKGVDVQPHVHPDYYRCYTMNFRSFGGKIITGITLIMHLDNFFDEQFDHLDVTHEMGKYTGAVLVLHEVGQFPPLNQKSVYLPPGYFTNVKTTFAARKRLGSPYTNCTDTLFVAGTNYTYTSEHCKSVCLERLIAAQCDCVDMFMLNILETTSHENLSFCNDIGQDPEQFKQKSRCANDVRKGFWTHCSKTCPIPCDDVTFETSTSSARWPPNILHEEFYESYIAGRPYEWRYKELEHNVFRVLNKKERNRNMLEFMHLIRNNFLRVDIDLNEDSFILNVALPKQTFSGFLSDLGGALNIFAGITFWVSVEMVEYLVMICCSRRLVRSVNIKPIS